MQKVEGKQERWRVDKGKSGFEGKCKVGEGEVLRMGLPTRLLGVLDPDPVHLSATNPSILSPVKTYIEWLRR